VRFARPGSGPLFRGRSKPDRLPDLVKAVGPSRTPVARLSEVGPVSGPPRRLPDLCSLRSQQVPVCRTSAVGGRSVPDLWVLLLGVVPVKPDLCLQAVEVGPGSRTSVKVIRTIRTSVELQSAFDSSQPDPCSWLVRPFLCVVRPLSDLPSPRPLSVSYDLFLVSYDLFCRPTSVRFARPFSVLGPTSVRPELQRPSIFKSGSPTFEL
jgi:hypothetical protein